MHSILPEKVAMAVASLKRGQSALVDNIQQNLFKLEGDRDRCFNRDL